MQSSTESIVGKPDNLTSDDLIVYLKHGIKIDSITCETIKILLRNKKIENKVFKWLLQCCRQMESHCVYDVASQLNDSVEQYLNGLISIEKLSDLRDHTNYNENNSAYDSTFWLISCIFDDERAPTLLCCIYSGFKEYKVDFDLKNELIKILCDDE